MNELYLIAIEKIKNIDFIINIISKVFAIAVIFESIEILRLKKYLKENGIWNDEIIDLKFDKLSINSKIYKLLKYLLYYRTFVKLIYLELLLGIVLIVIINPMILFFILLIKILISIKWNGSYNGGSDSMNIVICIGLIISSIYASLSENSNFQIAGVIYISFQLVLSYFRAGIVKFKNINWLNGNELNIFINNTIFDNQTIIHKFISKRFISIISSWFIILWEIIFIVSLFNIQLALIFCCVGLIFHLFNFYVFGLNRFLIIWLAAYPAFLHLSTLISR